MQTSRFQLGLVATLAAGLGFSLSSSEAVGYPASAVSSGSNPVWSVGGVLDASSSVAVLSVDGPHMAIVSDAVFTNSGNCHGLKFHLNTSTDGVIGAFRVSSDNYGEIHQPTTLNHAFRSGLPIQSGDTLTLTPDWSSACTVSYTLSGYYAQP